MVSVSGDPNHMPSISIPPAWSLGSPINISDCIVLENNFGRWYRGFKHVVDNYSVKLGGGSSASDRNPLSHVVKSVISFGNKRYVLADNSMPGDIKFERNTVYENGDGGCNTQSSCATYTSNLAAENIGTTDATTNCVLTDREELDARVDDQAAAGTACASAQLTGPDTNSIGCSTQLRHVRMAQGINSLFEGRLQVKGQ
ncbi:uncharacterized protein ColSpa_00036 [Colletotrichum spaethianum]|uniref:Pectate lyase n=1 Tax=Colletotrichum spaethianum TaxID=700344 RepID=A0AA37L428_9PEZI|nr:uncharacterized protein ColSpa_00036 [Colletotrichum spaethianum]GKT39855.1 hypothetical protein ColSpa_00036 [Colletotrichum spaethianum]